ncbi:MAG TPA: hypothetical protein VFF78_07625, partial [Anaerolineaceae bacterium]|nr:hypothetical protein [Anaerolineaceae bacterium]
GITPFRERLADIGLYILPGFTTAILPGLARASLGLENDSADVQHFLTVLAQIATQPVSFLDRFAAHWRSGTPHLAINPTTTRIQCFIENCITNVFR